MTIPVHGARVLLAEDDRVTQRLAMRLLEKMGCTVDAVGNGHEVIEALGRQSYAMVFMDCHMPELDGFQTTREIRGLGVLSAGPEPRPVHIVALTANALKGDRERCLAAGMNDYLANPIRVEELRAALARGLPRLDQPSPKLNP